MVKIARMGLLLLMAGCSTRQVESIVIKGSDTEVNAVLQLAELYMEQDSAVSISITGGGSGVGIAALLNGKTDIANSSREIEPQEQQFAAQRGLNLVPTILAVDALVVITHPDVGLDSLTLQQVGALFSGDIRDWRDLGGKPGPVSLYGRQSNSGTFIFFRENVLGRDFSPDLKQMNGTAQIIEAVKNDPGGIGYVSLGYALETDGRVRDGLHVISLKSGDQAPAVSPVQRDKLLQGEYPLLRPLIQYTSGPPQGKIRTFLEFEQSPAGHAIMAENGYLPVTPGRLTKELVDKNIDR